LNIEINKQEERLIDIAQYDILDYDVNCDSNNDYNYDSQKSL